MAATLTHCKRELIHTIFSQILNDKFIHAYQHSFVVECRDGHHHRLFPQILIYSADYPEKCIHSIWLSVLLSKNTKNTYRVLLSTIKSNTEHLCPHCLVKKINTIKMRTQLDMHYCQSNARINDHIRQATVKQAR